MESSQKLIWIQLKTTVVRKKDEYDVVHDVKLFPELQTQGTCSKNGERWSPLFLVGEPSTSLDLGKDLTGDFWLFFDTTPVQLAAHLQSTISAEIPHWIFLTHGMASVVVWAPSKTLIINTKSLFAARNSMVAIERWKVKKGHISKAVVLENGETSDNRAGEETELLTQGNMPHTAFRQMQDNSLVIRRITDLCRLYRPLFEQGVRDLLTRYTNMFSDFPSAFDHASDSDTEEWKNLQGKAYSVIHLNSMLSYFLSQGLSCHPPVLEQHGLLPSHSLFGVATAYQAVWQITHFIEEGFVRFDVLSEMENQYFDKTCPEFSRYPFKPALDHMQPRPSDSVRKAPGHVNLFSGRLGFHSSYWAIAAPVDTLYEAAAPGWNLLTLSHELLHVHVDRLLEFVLSPNPRREASLSQDDLYKNMISLAQPTFMRTDISIIDRLRQIVARYILMSGGCRGEDAAPLSQLPNCTALQVPITTPNEFRDMLLAFWRRLAEYLVHILDSYYFYCGDVERYLCLVLQSWASIPSVYDDIGHYIMRCLLTVSTRDLDPDGTGMLEPLGFDDSIEIFKNSLVTLDGSGECGHLVATIREFFRHPDNEEYLRFEFERAEALVWITVMYFYSRPLRNYFEVGTAVKGGILPETVLCPEFEFCSVQERLPRSPVSFLSKYLRNEYAHSDECQDVPVEGVSTWLFSWIASSGQPEGGDNALRG